MRSNGARIKDALNAFFKSFADYRNDHFHTVTYKDDHIRRLELTSLVNGGELAWPAQLRRASFRKAKTEWKTAVIEWNKHIDLVMDGYFTVLYEMTFYDDGSLALERSENRPGCSTD
jgi:hypothetical protein